MSQLDLERGVAAGAAGVAGSGSGPTSSPPVHSLRGRASSAAPGGYYASSSASASETAPATRSLPGSSSESLVLRLDRVGDVVVTVDDRGFRWRALGGERDLGEAEEFCGEALRSAIRYVRGVPGPEGQVSFWDVIGIEPSSSRLPPRSAARPLLARASSALVASSPCAGSTAAASVAAALSGLSGLESCAGDAEDDEESFSVLCVGRGKRPCDWHERRLTFRGAGRSRPAASKGAAAPSGGGGGGGGRAAAAGSARAAGTSGGVSAPSSAAPSSAIAGGVSASSSHGGADGKLNGGAAGNGSVDTAVGSGSGSGSGSGLRYGASGLSSLEVRSGAAAPSASASASASLFCPSPPSSSGSRSSVSALERLLSRGVARAAATQRRPRRVLALLNPVSGRGTVPRLFREVAMPAFAAAGVQVDVLETRRAGHAGEAVRALGRERIAELDGILAAGGDGAFHELLDAVLDPASLPELRQLRLGHLPAGSTDAVACSLHGTRSFFAAVAHVCLGDAGRMDVMETSWWSAEDLVGNAEAGGDLEARRAGAGNGGNGGNGGAASSPCPGGGVGTSTSTGPNASSSSSSSETPLLSPSTWSSPGVAASARAPPPGWTPPSRPTRVRHAACIAAAGFMGEICHAAELPAARRLGPLRYDLLGAWTVVRSPHASARVDVRASRLADASFEPAPCGAGCRSCAAGRAAAEPWRRLSSREWLSLMFIASPCISDKTPAGMARHAHLCDGRGWLVALPRSAGRIGMLKLLLALANRGLATGDPAEAEIEPVEEALFAADGLRLNADGRAALAPGAEPLRWNLDGEPRESLLLRCKMLQGGVHVFSRGVETTAVKA